MQRNGYILRLLGNFYHFVSQSRCFSGKNINLRDIQIAFLINSFKLSVYTISHSLNTLIVL